MRESNADRVSAHITDDGEHTVQVVVGSRHQDHLERLAQGRDEAPASIACTALLMHEPSDCNGSHVISVSIDGAPVGYLPPDHAADLIDTMRLIDIDHATCAAVIEDGWYRSGTDKGDFTVRLKVNFAFADVTFASKEVPPPADSEIGEPSDVPTDLSMGEHQPINTAIRAGIGSRAGSYRLVGALVTSVFFLALGLAWLVVPQPTGAVTDDHRAVPSSKMRQNSRTIASLPPTVVNDQLPAGALVKRDRSVAAAPLTLAPEIRPSRERERALAYMAVPTVKAIGTPVVLAAVAFELPPVPRPVPSEARSEAMKHASKSRAGADARSRPRANTRKARWRNGEWKRRAERRSPPPDRVNVRPPANAPVREPPAARLIQAWANEWSRALERPLPAR